MKQAWETAGERTDALFIQTSLVAISTVIRTLLWTLADVTYITISALDAQSVTLNSLARVDVGNHTVLDFLQDRGPYVNTTGQVKNPETPGSLKQVLLDSGVCFHCLGSSV